MKDMILGKWHEYEVRTVGRLGAPFVVDEGQRLILIGRTWRVWRMLQALVDAMNTVGRLDKNWADRMDGKTMMLCSDVVTIAGREWRINGCAVINPNATVPTPFSIDPDECVIKLSGRMNIVAAGPALIKAVVETCNEEFAGNVRELLESVTEKAAA